MDIAKFKKQFGEDIKDSKMEELFSSLDKAQEYLERVSDIETKIINIEKNSSTIETDKTIEEITEELKETNLILSTEVGKYISVYGIKYVVVSDYPKMFKVKKTEHKKHVIPIKPGHKIKLMGKEYYVVKAEPQHITFRK